VKKTSALGDRWEWLVGLTRASFTQPRPADQMSVICRLVVFHDPPADRAGLRNDCVSHIKEMPRPCQAIKALLRNGKSVEVIARIRKSRGRFSVS
jgi:hypothetical protein